MNGKIIAAKPHNIENGILGVQNNPEIQDKPNDYGYTPERISEGKLLLDNITGIELRVMFYAKINRITGLLII